MTFELMSNGKLARLPQTSIPEGVAVPAEPYVMLLLPHNRYLLGRSAGGEESWTWGRPGDVSQKVFLYDGERLSLSDEEMVPIALPGEAVSLLKGELLAQMEPPGDHVSAALLLRGFMRDHAAFADGFPFQDEAAFARSLEQDDVLRKVYWTLRFALARGEFDEMARLKAWLKAGPDLFTPSQPGSAPAGDGMRIWFSILDIPDETALQELEALSFSREDLQHMTAQRISPLILYNPQSGYLVLARFGRNGGNPTSFLVWAFLPPSLWGELRERRKLSVHELLLALWGQYDIEQALNERARYAAPDARGGTVYPL